MTCKPNSILVAAVMAASCTLAAHAEGDPTAGKTLYAARCSACHSVDFNGAGPMHKNLLGRHAGTAPGFAYSKALKESNLVWTQDNLLRWLADPEKLVPGQKMFVSVANAQERADIVAYLQLITGPQPTTPAKTGAKQ
jgi:cytochrome c